MQQDINQRKLKINGSLKQKFIGGGNVNRLEDISVVVWSLSRNTPILDITYESWSNLAEKLCVPIFIATDDSKLKGENIIRFQRNNWREEWTEVIDKLESKGMTRIISVLDDFYLVSSSINKKIIRDFYDYNWSYLSLVPHPNISAMIPYKKVECIDDYYKIPHNWRYRNSLQVSCWKLNVFRELLVNSKSIWNFEEIESTYDDFICVKYRRLKYRHILEKGQLNYNSILFCSNHFRYLKKFFNYNYNQTIRLPKIIVSNILIRLLGFRISGKNKV